MFPTKPKVFLIAETTTNHPELKAALEAIGGKTAVDWLATKITKGHAGEDGQLLTEVAGRTCYKSFGVGLNPNVTKIREDSKDYFANTMSKGDGSILEHGTVTFIFVGVSRVFTHELVRHRAGSAFSQESGRYVRIDSTNPMQFWEPDLSRFDKHLKGQRPSLEVAATEIERTYLDFQNAYDWNKMDMNTKKDLTSQLRRILPNGMANTIVWTANHRTLRHVIAMRTSPFAETEIRMVFDEVAGLLKAKFPLIYQDFEQGPALPDGTHTWTPKYQKV